MTGFETFAAALGARNPGLSTGLPQLDRIAPLGPGHLAVLIGASGVGKSRVSNHAADTVGCTHERGVFAARTPTTIDALDTSIAFHNPALVVIDPLTALTTAEELAGTSRATNGYFADPDSGLLGESTSASGIGNPQRPAEPARQLGQYSEQQPVHPAELGRVAIRLRELAHRHHVPMILCHRYTPIRDSVTSQIVSTEAANPLLDQADMVAVVRVLADPRQVGLELIRNRLGPLVNLRVPLPPAEETPSDRRHASREAVPPTAGAQLVPTPRTPPS